MCLGLTLKGRRVEMRKAFVLHEKEWWSRIITIDYVAHPCFPRRSLARSWVPDNVKKEMALLWQTVLSQRVPRVSPARALGSLRAIQFWTLSGSGVFGPNPERVKY